MDTHQGVYNVILCSSDGSIQKILLGFGFDSKLNSLCTLLQLLALILFLKKFFSCSVFNVGTSVLEKKWIWI